MQLVIKNGIKPEEKASQGTAKERKIYVCDLHPEEVYDKPGECRKGSCAGMKLEERTLTPDWVTGSGPGPGSRTPRP